MRISNFAVTYVKFGAAGQLRVYARAKQRGEGRGTAGPVEDPWHESQGLARLDTHVRS
jgi:hypothetical protein